MGAAWEARLDRVLAGARRGGLRVQNTESGAAYHFADDLVSIGPAKRFGGPAGRARVLLHELGHSTAYRSRLDRRPAGGATWESSYTREEIVAELISYRVAKRLGIPSGGIESPRQYVRAEAKHLGGRTRAEASSIVRDAREGEQYLLRGGALARARPQLGAGN